MSNFVGVIENALTVAMVNLLIVGIIGAAVRGAFTRWLDRQDKRQEELEREVKRLREVELQRLSQNIDEMAEMTDERFRNATSARKGIHEDIARVRETYMPKSECVRAHTELNASIAALRSLDTSLARAEEKQASTARQMAGIAEQLAGIVADVARLDERSQKGVQPA